MHSQACLFGLWRCTKCVIVSLCIQARGLRPAQSGLSLSPPDLSESSVTYTGPQSNPDHCRPFPAHCAHYLCDCVCTSVQMCAGSIGINRRLLLRFALGFSRLCHPIEAFEMHSKLSLPLCQLSFSLNSAPAHSINYIILFSFCCFLFSFMP